MWQENKKGENTMTGRIIVRNGYWNCVISYKDELGKYKQKWINTNLKERGNKTRAKEVLNEEVLNFAKELGEQKAVALLGDMTFLQWMKKYVEKKKAEISASTYVGYRRSLNIFETYFGNEIKLKDIYNTNIEEFFKYLKEERKIKNATIKYYCTILYPALREAYKNDYILKNPVDFMAPIRQEQTHHSYYNKKDLKLLFKVIKGHITEIAIKVAAYYGLRRSELIGLRWQSVDFYNKVITIENKVVVVGGEVVASNVLKNSSSRRALPLLAEVERDLKQHKKNIENNMSQNKSTYNFNFEEYVFVNQVGNLIRPHYISQSLRTIIKTHKLKKIRFHDLRHSCASLLLANGISIKQIQEWLGHSSFKTTADIYSHLDFKSKIDSANKLSKALSFNKDFNKSTEELITEIATLKEELKNKEELLKMKLEDEI